MEKTTYNNYPANFDDLITELESGNYKHLQIFAYKEEPNHIFGVGQQHLVVNHSGFTMFKLTSLKLGKGNIQSVITNPDTGNPMKIKLNVKDAKSDLFLINWVDFWDLFYADRTNPDEELLKLDSE